MAHIAQLNLDGGKYDIIECEYEFNKPVKENGQPAGFASGGFIHLIVITPDDKDLTLYEWMQSSTEQKDGDIVFSVVDLGEEATKSLHFEGAYCIRLYDYFNKHNNVQMFTKITISAAQISFGSVVFKNDRK